MSKHMTLKQRRRHRELVAEFDRLKPKLPPIDFELGKDSEQDEQYREVIEAFNIVVEEMHAIEEAASRGRVECQEHPVIQILNARSRRRRGA